MKLLLCDFSTLLVIHPPIGLAETLYTNQTTYNKTVRESQESAYVIHAGAQFGVECSSVATPDNEFVGRVTWYRKVVSESGLFINVQSM